MKVAWQTPVVLVVTVLNTVIALIATNTKELGISSPWLTIVVIPAAVAAGTLIANQLKTIGAESPPKT